MNNILVLENGSVELTRDGVPLVVQGRLAGLFASARSRLLPRGCRQVFSLPSQDVYVIEQPPGTREVIWPSTEGTVNLAFPYVVFLVLARGDAVESIRVYFRSHPLRARSDYLFDVGIPEISVSDLNVVREFSFGETLADRLSAVIDAFWSRPFPQFSSVVRIQVPVVSELTSWREMSEHDPLSLLSQKWPASARTLEQTAAGSVDGTQVEDVAFQILVDALERRPPERNDVTADLSESPVREIFLTKSLVRLGDEVTANDRRVVVTGFYQDAKGIVVALRAEGIGSPVHLNRGVTPISARQQEWKSLETWTDANGTVWGKGSRFMVTDDSGPRLSVGTEYSVMEIRLDADADVQVQVGGFWFWITMDGGTLLHGVSAMRPVLTAEAFRFGMSELRVGSVIRLHNGRKRGSVVVVARLWSSDTTLSMVYVDFEGVSEHEVLFAGGVFTFSWEVIPFERSERRVRFLDRTLDLSGSDGMVLDFSGDNRHVVTMKVIGFKRNVRPGADPCDTDLVLDPCNEPIPVIRDGAWVPFKHRLLRSEWSNGPLTIVRGMRLRVAKRCGELEAGTILEVNGVVISTRGIPAIEFTNGVQFPLGRQGMSLFEVMAEDGSRRRFRSADLTGLPSMEMKPSSWAGPYEEGTLLEYMGNDQAVLKRISGSSFGPRIVEFVSMCCQQHPIKVRIHPGGDPVSLTNSSRLVIRVSGLPERSSQMSSSRRAIRFVDDYGQEITLSDDLRQMRDEIERLAPNSTLTEDSNVMVRVGDVVRVDRGYRWGRGASIRDGATGIVVEISDNLLYVLCDAHGVLDPARDDDRGYMDIPEKCRPDSGPLRVGVTMIKNLTVMRREELEERKQGPVSHSVGTFVSVQPGITPSCGWGNVGPTDRGRIIQVLGEDALVAFPREPEWVGLLSELVTAFLRIGDMVRVRAGVVHAYRRGTVTDMDEGVIVRVEAPDHLVVDFPSHPGWHAHPDDLEIVKLSSSS
ncbi:hypothetical protein A2304_05360 [Candidatus Uhrbacteria bacterium RIFOXYB2_FULL_57_15]|uniref:Uncharacterized protein n=1 Tax=Candidatus Uhrbacteria bacterium RIFOXYB2_FULL_57_15 TaxID=1802422 RepID=A0A1F7W566_9BACT|nr:MAG: hypothetical protein A2304_05360 [Candidatus Uhrbacteria bacterium RIFOXYB2_FULL_57_15]OGM00635.1 MAG: hypothetical protein A2501_04025 [Candidatus Uhrbacteria bacterium RIFOXYC12_FULL_57_11]